MRTVIKQAIRVNVPPSLTLVKYGNKQHVTKPPRKYVFLPKQPKENTEKYQKYSIFCILQTKNSVVSPTKVYASLFNFSVING